MRDFYLAQLRILLQIIECYQFSSDPEHVAAVSSAWFSVARYEAKLAELDGAK